MKTVLLISILTSLSTFARTQHWNSIECKGSVATYSSSFSEGGDSEERSSIIGENLEVGVHYKIKVNAIKEISFKEDKEKCVDGAGNDLGVLNNTERKFTQLVKITFNNSNVVPQNLRNKKVTDILSCVEKFEETADECM